MPEDSTPSTPESFLDYVRRQRTDESASRTTNASTIIRGAIQGSTDNNSRNDAARREEKYNISGTNGNVESGYTNGSQLGGVSRSIDSGSTGGDSSVNQRVRPDTGQPASGSTRNFFSGVKSTFAPFREAIKRQSLTTPPQKKKVVIDKRLTDTEIIKLRPKVIEGILWTSEHMDQGIQATTKGHRPVEIWSSIDRDEAEILADFMISRGKVNVTAARYVRNIAFLTDRIKLGLIIVPRAYRTMIVYLERGFSIR